MIKLHARYFSKITAPRLIVLISFFCFNHRQFVLYPFPKIIHRIPSTQNAKIHDTIDTINHHCLITHGAHRAIYHPGWSFSNATLNSIRSINDSVYNNTNYSLRDRNSRETQSKKEKKKNKKEKEVKRNRGGREGKKQQLVRNAARIAADTWR